MKHHHILGILGLATLLLFGGCWLYATWSTRRTERVLTQHYAQERQKNASALREMLGTDGGVRDRMIRSLLAQGFLRPDGAQPLLTVGEFFDSNSDPYTVAANLDPHPPIAAFASTLKALERNPDVSSVRLEVVDFEDWPYSDTVYVVTALSHDQVLDMVSHLRPTEVGTASGDAIHPGLLPIKPHHQVFVLWWD